MAMPGRGTFDLSGIKPGPQGQLIIEGAGIIATSLIFNDEKHALMGREVYRVRFKNMHMTRAHYTVSQGHVVRVGEGRVELKIQRGFPSPNDIYNANSDSGRYLREYTNSKTSPQLIDNNSAEAAWNGNNRQYAWQSAEVTSQGNWILHLKNKRITPHYKVGTLIGIKSKHGGQTYWFSGGADIAFENVKWTHKTRGVFRGGISHIRFTNCVTERAPAIHGQVPCLAVPGGGPQIGQLKDPPTSNNIVEGCRFVTSGDDAVAFINGTGTVRNCYISDAFARGINLENSPNVVLKNNQLVRAPLKIWRNK